MKILQLGPAHAEAVTNVALKGKAYWGYDDEFMENCREELTYREETFGRRDVFGTFMDGKLVGFYALGTGKPRCGLLEDFFVLPDYIGGGIGRKLFAHCLEESRRRGWKKLNTDSDPFAEGFYKKMGWRRVGSSPSGSIPGRVLPLMEFEL